MNINDLKEFKKYLIKNKSVSNNTLQSYICDNKNFINYLCDETTFKDYTEINEDDIISYVDYLENKGRSSSTITRSIASIRCYYKFLILLGKADFNPAKNIKRTQKTKKKPSVLTASEIKLLLSQPNVNDLKGYRDKAMLELLYATGIKVSELINLDINDVNLKSGILICKNSHCVRIVPIYKTALEHITIYILKVRKSITSIDSGQALFVNLSGNRLTRQGFWKIIKNYANKANIKKDITPYTMRHSFALHLLENGAALKDIQEMLGHADISSTQIYVDLMSSRFKNVYNKFHPMAKTNNAI